MTKCSYDYHYINQCNVGSNICILYIPNDNLEDSRLHLKSLPEHCSKYVTIERSIKLLLPWSCKKENIHHSSVIIFPQHKSFEMLAKSCSSDLVRPGMQTPQCSFANNCSLAQGCIPEEERFLICLFPSTCYLGDWVTTETWLYPQKYPQKCTRHTLGDEMAGN